MTFISSSSAMSLVVALGIGILIGAERERRKGGGSHRGAAGVRTFALAAFAGALSSYLKSEALLVVVAAAAILFSALAYRRGARQDPGLTTELALLVTVLLGGLSMQQPLLAAGLAVIITLLLAGRERLHYVFKNLLSEQEAHDALMFLAAALVMLPLSPNREFGPLGILNPRKICELVVLVMAVSAAGYLMLRLLGARLGLAVAGFLGGFISASATIGSMGRRMRRSPELEGAATSGAVLTTVATVLQMLLVLLATNVATFRALALPLLLAGIAALGYALLFVVKSPKTSGQEPAAGKAFDLRTAVLFAVSISAILFFCAFLNQRYGSRGLFLGAAISGLADTHATAISIASMVSSGKLGPRAAVLPILLGFTANSLTKSVVAFAMGGFRFGLKIFLGLTLVVSAAFLGVWLTR